MNQPTTAADTAEAIRRAEIAAQLEAILREQLNPSTARGLWATMRLANRSLLDDILQSTTVKVESQKQLTETLPQALAFIATAINEDWLGELIGRMARQPS